MPAAHAGARAGGRQARAARSTSPSSTPTPTRASPPPSASRASPPSRRSRTAASSTSSSARSRRRRSSASSTASCPPRPTRSSRPATRPRCAARSSSSPAAPTPRVALARLLRDRGERDEALELLESVAGSFAAEGLAARIRLEQADDPDLAEAFAALDAGDSERGLDALIDAHPGRRRRQGRPAPRRRRRARRARRRAPARARVRAAGSPPRCTSRDARDTLPSGPHGHRPPGRRRVLRQRRAAAPPRAARQAGHRLRIGPARGGHHRVLRGAPLRRRLGHADRAGAAAVPRRDPHPARLPRLPRHVGAR